MQRLHPILRFVVAAQHRRVLVCVVGGVLEVCLVLLIGSDDTVSHVRGIGGESVVCLAVLGALLGGPLVGGLMAAIGWAAFFPLIADSKTSSLVALPVWVLVAYLVGLLSEALVRLERSRVESERDVAAAHALRTPVATIHGLVSVLDRHDGTPAEPLIRAIVDETDRLLRSPFFLDREP